MKKRTDRRSVSLGDDINQWLDKSAAQRRTSVSFIIREALLPAFSSRHSDRKRAKKAGAK